MIFIKTIVGLLQLALILTLLAVFGPMALAMISLAMSH